MADAFSDRAGPESKVGGKTWLSIICFGLLTYYILTTFQSYWRLRHFPGPKLAALTNWWWVRAAISGKGHLVLSDVCTKYGSIARIGPDTIVTCDEDLFRKMNAYRGSTYTKGNWYKAFKFDADQENLFSQLDEEKHMNLRNRVTVGYSGKDNPNLEPDVDHVFWNLIALIRRKYLTVRSALKPMDFAEKAQFLTLDVITSLSLGEPLGWVSEDEDVHGYIKTVEENFPMMNVVSAIPFLAAVMRIPSLQKAAIPKVTDRVGLGKLKAVAREMISRRFGEDKDTRNDMTGSFIAHGLTQAEIADESMLQILAGSDTTATILRTGFISVVSNPQIYARLQAECLGADVPMSEIISMSRAQQLPYLQACVKEALRHNPAATGLLPRVVGPDGDTHNGIYIPPGITVGFCAWNIHRNNTGAYGEDAAIFRPERWLEANPQRLARMEEAFHLVFGFGRYRCMGENIAKIELNKMFFEMFRRFDWSFVDPTRVLEKNMNYGLFIQKGIWVRVSERQT